METEKVKYKYIFENNYNPRYVNGAIGGASSRGEFVINFYFERMALPNSQSFEVREGRQGEEIKDDVNPNDYQNSLVRVVESGIILDYKNAKEIHRWLGEHIKALEDLTQKDE